MAIKREERNINGRQFAVTQLPAMRALKLSTRLGKLFGPALAKLAASGPASRSLGDMEAAALGSAAETLFASLGEKEIEDLARDLLITAEVLQDGAWVQLFGPSPTFDAVMGGDVLGIFKLIFFAVEVNYADFFGALRGVMTAAKVSPSKGSSPSPTAGPDGGSS